MLVIHSDFGDADTKVLTTLWKDIENVNVITITRESNKTIFDDIKRALQEEKDTVLFCGHGSSGGLWTPSYGFAFAKQDIPLVAAKNIIGIWCHASDFSKLNGVRGFYSSMFISNSGEARMNGITGVSDDQITKSEVLFCKRVNKLLKEGKPISEWLENLTSYNLTNPVEEFNYGGLFYNDGTFKEDPYTNRSKVWKGWFDDYDYSTSKKKSKKKNKKTKLDAFGDYDDYDDYKYEGYGLYDDYDDYDDYGTYDYDVNYDDIPEEVIYFDDENDIVDFKDHGYEISKATSKSYDYPKIDIPKSKKKKKK